MVADVYVPGDYEAIHSLTYRTRRVHIFLVGLEGDFEQVRGEILRKDPILN